MSSLDPSVGQPELDDDSDDQPTGYGDAAAMIVELFPKAAPRMAAYQLLWSIVAAIVVAVVGWALVRTGIGMESYVTTDYGAGGFTATTGQQPSMMMYVMLSVAASAVASYFWSLQVRHLDEIYEGEPTGVKPGIKQQFVFGFGAAGKVFMTWFVQAVLVGLVLGGLYLLGGLIMEEMELGGGQLGLTEMAMVAGAFIVAGIIYVFVHFADVAAVVDDCGLMDALSRAGSIVSGFGDWFFAVVWAVLSLVILVVWQVAVGLGLTVFEGMFGEGLLTLGISAAVGGLTAVLVVPFLVTVNYAVYQCLCARQGPFIY